MHHPPLNMVLFLDLWKEFCFIFGLRQYPSHRIVNDRQMFVKVDNISKVIPPGDVGGVGYA